MICFKFKFQIIFCTYKKFTKITKKRVNNNKNELNNKQVKKCDKNRKFS